MALKFTALLLATVALSALPSALASNPPSPEFVISYHSESGDEILSWTPVVQADSYTIWRGTDPHDLQVVGHTTAPIFFDEYIGEGTLYYAVSAAQGMSESSRHIIYAGPGSGSCTQSSGTHVEVTISGCGPGHM